MSKIITEAEIRNRLKTIDQLRAKAEAANKMHTRWERDTKLQELRLVVRRSWWPFQTNKDWIDYDMTPLEQELFSDYLADKAYKLNQQANKISQELQQALQGWTSDEP